MNINCAKCGRLVVELEKGRVRNGAVVYCGDCAKRSAALEIEHELRAFEHGFMKGIFK